MFEKCSHSPTGNPHGKEVPRPEEARSIEELGDFLRRVRERNGASLNEVAKTTKVKLKYLEALEGASLSRLPGRLYGRGYLQAYLSFLNQDPAPWVRRYEELVEMKR